MTDSTPRTFSADFRRFFLRGLVVLLPTVLTLWIVVYAYQFIHTAIAEPINSSLRLGMYELAPYWQPLRTWFDPDESEVQANLAAASAVPTAVPPPTHDEVFMSLREAHILQWWKKHWYMDVIGLVVAVVMVYVAGRLLGGFLGRRVYRGLERLITRVPVFKQVYPHVKQVVDFLFAEDRTRKFSRVVACEYPRKGVWVMGFQTGPAFRRIQDMIGESVTVFIPSTPGTFTGYTAVLPCSDVVELPITVEEAIRFAVSGGVLVPDGQLVPTARLWEDAMLKERPGSVATVAKPPRAAAPGGSGRGAAAE